METRVSKTVKYLMLPATTFQLRRLVSQFFVRRPVEDSLNEMDVGLYSKVQLYCCFDTLMLHSVPQCT